MVEVTRSRVIVVSGAAAVGALVACAVMLPGATSSTSAAAPTSVVATPAAPAPVTRAAVPTTTVAPTTTAAADTGLTDFAGEQPGLYYFTSPDGKFQCGLFTDTPVVAGCHGAIPADAPKVSGPSGSGSPAAPNTIQVTVGSPAQFLNAGDPKFLRVDGTAKPLPVGQSLAAAGLDCTAADPDTVSCHDNHGHGFTVSANDFTLN